MNKKLQRLEVVKKFFFYQSSQGLKHEAIFQLELLNRFEQLTESKTTFDGIFNKEKESININKAEALNVQGTCLNNNKDKGDHMFRILQKQYRSTKSAP